MRAPGEVPGTCPDRILLDSIADEELLDLHDRAFLSVLLYSFSRVSAVVDLKVRDYEHQHRRAYLALCEKGGQHRRSPIHSRAAEALAAYLPREGQAARHGRWRELVEPEEIERVQF